jgi:hypothetical protein
VPRDHRFPIATVLERVGSTFGPHLDGNTGGKFIEIDQCVAARLGSGLFGGEIG